MNARSSHWISPPQSSSGRCDGSGALLRTCRVLLPGSKAEAFFDATPRIFYADALPALTAACCRYNLESQFPPSDPAFDFRSPSFDAARALANPTLIPPVAGPGAPKPFDNLTKCRNILPASHPDKTAARPTRPPGSGGGGGDRRRASKTSMATTTTIASPKDAPNLFERAAADYEAKNGPLALLAGFLRSHAKVRVVVRRRTGVRGWCSGYLKVRDPLFCRGRVRGRGRRCGRRGGGLGRCRRCGCGAAAG